MITIHHDERCTCSRPHYTASYFGRRVCRCGKFIVISEAEAQRLDEEERRQTRAEILREGAGPPLNGNGSNWLGGGLGR